LDGIEIEDDFLTLEMKEFDRTIYMPLNLHSCNQREYILMCSLIYRLENGAIQYDDFKRFVVYGLLNLKKGRRNISTSELDDAFSTIGFIAEYVCNYFYQKEGKHLVKVHYRKSNIEIIDPELSKLYAPGQYFVNVTWKEYGEALNVFFEYNRTKDVKLLLRLCGILYQENSGARRVKYDVEAIENRVKKMRYASMGVLYGVYYNFAAFHTYFSSSCVSWEGKIIDMSIIFSEQEGEIKNEFESSFPSLGLKSISYQLAESGVFGNDKELGDANLWEVALRLYDIRKRDLDRKAQETTEKK